MLIGDTNINRNTADTDFVGDTAKDSGRVKVYRKVSVGRVYGGTPDDSILA
jgi:hypothetical protein